MTTRPFPAGLFLLLLVCLLSSMAGAQKADITLEGPWILYVDTSARQTWPVLVAISPGGVSNDNDVTYFHSISIDNGDGYPTLNPGVYCLTFDTACTPKPTCASNNSCPASLSPDGYPQVVTPLPVTAGSSWDWSHKWITPQYATAFVLPMPDYYTVDTGWFMRFYKQLDVTGRNYTPKAGKQYATALHLHYDNGPKTFALSNCSPQPKAPLDLSACTPLTNTDFDNIGTLHLSMRAPETDNACDPHVRRAYPRMIGLLDSDNSKIGVIDIANGFDHAKKIPTFDVELQDPSEVGTKGYRCLEYDSQPKTQDLEPAFHGMSNTLPLLAQLNTFITQYEADKEHHRELADQDLLLPQLQDAYGKLDKSFPRFSQDEFIRTLLVISRSRLETLLIKRDGQIESPHDLHALNGNVNSNISLYSLYLIENAILDADGPPTKSGADCKAPVMMVQ